MIPENELEEAAIEGLKNQNRLKELIGEEAADILIAVQTNLANLYLELNRRYNNLHESHHALCDAFEQLHDLTCPNCLNISKDDNKIKDVLDNDTIT